MDTASVRILVVDDYEPWRRFVSSTLRKQPNLQVICEVSDGLEAVQKAQELKPDLILLDIGLPTLNGIEVAKRIRDLSPNSKILFASANRDWDVATEAVGTGAGGYITKSDAERELVTAVLEVLEGKQFVSASLTDHNSIAPPKNEHAAAMTHSHEVAFYTDDASLVDGYARFIKSALKNGNVVIVVVNEAHRARLLSRLEADGVDVPTAIEEGSYVALDAAEAMSRLTVNDMPDPARCAKVIGDLITGAAKGGKGEHGRVAICGETAPTLLSKGHAEGAIKLEHLWDEIARGYDVDILCGYLSSAFPDKKSSPIFEGICAEHTAVQGRELGYYPAAR